MCHDRMVRCCDTEILILVLRMNHFSNWHNDGTVHFADVFVQLVFVLRLPRALHKRTVNGWQLDSHIFGQRP